MGAWALRGRPALAPLAPYLHRYCKERLRPEGAFRRPGDLLRFDRRHVLAPGIHP